MPKRQRRAPDRGAWKFVDDVIDAVEAELNRPLDAVMADAHLITVRQRRMVVEKDPAGAVALSIAATEGNRQRIYDRNQRHVTARWETPTGKVVKVVEQVPMFVVAQRETPDGHLGPREGISVTRLVRAEYDAYRAERRGHITGETAHLDVHDEFAKVWDRFPRARTLGEALQMAGLRLDDLRFVVS